LELVRPADDVHDDRYLITGVVELLWGTLARKPRVQPAEPVG
jgi:hypothetical protein